MGKTYKFSAEEEACDNCGRVAMLKPSRSGMFCNKCFETNRGYTKPVDKFRCEDEPLK